MFSEQATILVIDDERSVTDLLSEDLAEEGYHYVTADTGEAALKRLSKDNFDVVLLDLKLPGISGIDVLKQVKSNCPETVVIVVTGTGDTQTAVEVMKIGAVDYITKPFELERVNSSIKEALKAKVIWSGGPASQEESTEVGSEEIDWIRYLDKITEGVETRLDSLTGHVMTTTVIEETIGIARSMEIPEEQIEKWGDSRQKHIERVKIVNHLLAKV